jgi:hypothetical protein
MSQIEQYQDRGALTTRDHQGEAVARLSEWATSAQAAMAVAHELSRSSFVPEAFRNKPGEATAAILAGLEVGLQPMAALRSFDVIQGQAAARAITLRAIVQSHGHEIELVESTATRCKMRGRRRGSDAWQDVTWTMDRARQLGLDRKPNWKNQPQAMLVARCTSEIARLIASDAILGIAYSSEEIADGAGAGVEVPAVTTADPETPGAPTAPAGKKRMSRAKKATPAPAAEPEAPEQTEAEAAELADEERCAAIQSRIDDLSQEERQDLGGWWKEQRHPALKSGDLEQAIAAYAGAGATSGRNKKMRALVNEAWPDESSDLADARRKALIGVVSDGRTTSSKDLTDAEWDGLFVALDQLVAKTMELHLRSSGDYELRAVRSAS